jgi:hypothetical protein
MGTSEHGGASVHSTDPEPVSLSGSPRLAFFVALALTACATTGTATGTASASPTLTAADGSAVTLASLAAGREATVLVFWSAGCPCVRRYQARVDALAERYASDSRVRVLAVVANAGESFEEARGGAGVHVPLFHDEGGEVAKRVGARSTPTAAVLDAKGRVRFLGWIDNEREPGASDREPWLENALEGLLGNASFTSRTPTWGCTITRSLFAAEPKACTSLH